MSQTVIILGYKFAVLPVAAEFKARGYRTLMAEIEGGFPHPLPDYLACYDKAIDVSIVVPGWDDPEAIRAALRMHSEWPPAGVYTQLDEAAVTTAILRQEAGLPTSPPAVIELIVDKLQVRRELLRLGRSKLAVLADQEIDALTNWPFPGRHGFVKNVHGAGGYGVRGVSNLDELVYALKELDAVTTSRPSLTQAMLASPGRMLEEAAAGTLVSFEAVVTNGHCVTIGFTRPHLLEADIGERTPRPMPGCVHPYNFSGDSQAEAFLAESLAALGYTDGPVHIEAIVTADGVCEIIDLNPRFAGAHCLWAMNAAHDTPVEKLLADWTLGQIVSADLPKASGAGCLQYFLAPPGDDRLESMVLPTSPQITWSAQFKVCGEALPADPCDGGWVGGFLVQAGSQTEALALASQLRHQVRVNDRGDVGY